MDNKSQEKYCHTCKKYKLNQRVVGINGLCEGTIVEIDHTDPDMPYRVQFDKLLLWMKEEDLELITDKPDYLTAHKACGIKVGDRVKVLRKAKSHERGWQNDWTDRMDKAVGEICEVTGDNGLDGYTLSGAGKGYTFPHFVLEKVPEPKPAENTKAQTCLTEWQKACLQTQSIRIIPPEEIYKSHKPIIKPERRTKMFRAISHFTLRRYVVACTLLVTAKIGQAMTPWMFKLVNLLPLPDVERVVDGEAVMMPFQFETGNALHTAEVWAITIAAATLCYFAARGYSKGCDWVLNRLEKKNVA